MTVHDLQELTSLVVKRNRVGYRSQTIRLVSPVLVGAEAAAAVVLGLFRALRVIQSIGGVVPDVDEGVGDWFPVRTIDDPGKVSVGGTRLVLSDDARTVRLDGYAISVERSKDGTECRRGLPRLLELADGRQPLGAGLIKRGNE